jgi:Tol biopolymer transport system component
MSTPRRFARVLAAAVVTLAAVQVEAQYFGRNPVQWRRFDFQILKTDHFDVYYYPEEFEAAQAVGRMAERWYARLSRLLEFDLEQRQPVILYASQPHFQQTNTIGAQPGEGTGGVTEVFKRRIVLPVGASLAETDHVLGHELVHAFQYAMTGQGQVSSTNFPSALRMPLWFIEGMAEYLSVGPVDAHTAMWMRDAARRDKLPTIRQLNNPRYFPYRYGQALWAYIGARFGDRVAGQALKAMGPNTNDAEAVLQGVLGLDHKTLSADWHAAIKAAHEPVAAARRPASAYGRALISDESQGGRVNVGPALSPDGRSLVFLSERSLFSIDLFLADATSGKVERQLSRTAVNPHLESLQFINSAGAWSPSGDRIALGAISEGRPVLVVLDPKGTTRREYRFDGLDEIFTPSFSPDSRSAVFSALAGGFTDLYVADLDGGALRRLTHDAYADLQPAWSPDGATIAFVSDRFTTRLDTLATGNYRLAAIDARTGDVRALPSFETSKNIDPQWARDGRSLYFLSDRDGVTNVYRVEPETQALFQVTDLVTGVSGITDLSPALATAARADRLAFSVYEQGNYGIYALDQPDQLRGTPVGFEEARQAALIPGAKPKGLVTAELDDATTGLGDTHAFVRAPYRPKLSLDYVGQPALVAGADRFGAFAGGGASLAFSDMLGNHTLETALSISSGRGFTDVGAVVAYVNRERRFFWGAALQQVPYTAGGFAAFVSEQDGRLLYVEQALIDRQIERRASLVGFYPLSRVTRVEVSGAYRNVSFDRRLQTDVFDYVTGGFLSSSDEKLEVPEAVHLGEFAAAFVRDTSLFGATSPILGQRMRFELSPSVAPLFVGYPNLVRGYDSGSFEARECGPDPGACPVFDRLLGSRLLVANAELRFPLAALFGARNLYGRVPIELGAFFDAGVAWSRGEKPTTFGGEREWVRSVGGTARLNVFGYLVFQVDFVKPLDRPGKGAFWQFNLIPGF